MVMSPNFALTPETCVFTHQRDPTFSFDNTIGPKYWPLGSTRCSVAFLPVVRDVANAKAPAASATAVVALPRGDTINTFQPAPEDPSEPEMVVAPAAPADPAVVMPAPTAITAATPTTNFPTRTFFIATHLGLKTFL